MSTTVSRYLPFDADWQMRPAERLAFIALVSHLRPRLAIEIGTRHGGSLAVLSEYCERVISLDIDPTVPQRLAHVTNAEFITGDSQRTLAPLLGRLAAERAPLGFALIDGDHSAEGVRRDCAVFLEHRPLAPLFLLMHDSFNPAVREGITAVAWERCPYVQALELDFVPGLMFKGGALDREMWGGFALAVLGPEPRTRPLERPAASDGTFRAVLPFSVHNVILRRTVQLGRLLSGRRARRVAPRPQA